jgi:hypothetical protein
VLQQLRNAAALDQGGQQTRCNLCFLQQPPLRSMRHVALLCFCRENSCDYEVEALCKDRPVLLVSLLLLR